MKNVHGMRRRFLSLAALIGIGIILGSIYLSVTNPMGIANTWEFEFENGRIILDAEDRNYLKEQALSVALEDEEIKELLAGKDYTTQVTLICNAKVENIFVNHTILQSTKRFAITTVELMVVVTVIFEDGSGYNIPVDWQVWTVGEPEFAEQVSPPQDLMRITATNSTERTRSLP